jgi:chromosome segregation ATPase
MTPRWKMLVLAMAVMSIGAGTGMSPRAIATDQPVAAHAREAHGVQEAQTSAQLLQEVRALRVAIERMTVAGTRAQLLFGRLQMQEQRLTSLAGQLQETRTRLASVQRDRQNHASKVEGLIEGIDHARNAEQRLDMEQALKVARQTLAQFDQQVSALQAEDVGIGQALSTEQARWVELNGRLEELEGQLATQKP